MKRALLRAATILATALTAAAIAASGATASPVLQRFSVPSGDNCTYGYTEGQIEWSSLAPAYSVTLTGVIADRPIPTDPILVCRDDGRYTIAKYLAYAGDRLVDETARRVDNGMARFQFTLGGSTAVPAIDRVTIQVCRVSLITPSPSPDYCGRVYTFKSSVISPTAVP